jgi:hypothetical protein
MPEDSRQQYDMLAAELTAGAPVVAASMFGMPSLKYEGKAFAGFTQGAMVFKLSAPAHAEALALAGAHLFDPSGRDRPMKEWVVVPGEHAERWPALARAALRYSGGPAIPD